MNKCGMSKKKNDNFLVHHGILGQKWGVRNGPPYPLSSSSSEKTQQKNSNEGNSNIFNFGKDFVSQHSTELVSTVGSYDDMTELAIAYSAAFAVFSVSALIAGKVSDIRGRKKQNAELEYANQHKQIKNFRDAPKMQTKKSPSQNMKETNPDYPTDGTTMNCTFCTTAMALRERGYNVKAAKSVKGKYSDDLFVKTFNSPEEKIKVRLGESSTKILSSLESKGDGAYGNLVVDWKLGGSHSVFWKNESGKVHIYDGQSGMEYTSDDATTQRFLSAINSKTVRYNRLDNCEPTEYALAVVERA